MAWRMHKINIVYVEDVPGLEGAFDRTILEVVDGQVLLVPCEDDTDGQRVTFVGPMSSLPHLEGTSRGSILREDESLFPIHFDGWPEIEGETE